MPVASVERFRGTLDTVKRELEQTDPQVAIVIFCPTDGEIERLAEAFAFGDGRRQTADGNRDFSERLTFIKGNLSGGFELFGRTSFDEDSAAVCRLPSAVLFLSAPELFEIHDFVRQHRAKRRQLSKVIDSFLDLKPGDLVVHIAHGIARFKGIQTLMKGQQEEEHLHLEFADTQALYVPISKIGLVQKYVAGNK